MKTKIEKFNYTPKAHQYKGIHFQSTLELRTYKILEKLPSVDIWTQSNIGKCNWCIDFRLIAFSNEMAEILGKIRSCDDDIILECVSDLYIEVKGVKDKNFIKRIQQLDCYDGYLLDRLLLVGSSLDAVAWYSKRLGKIKVKPIVPLSYLSDTIKNVLIG